MRSNCCEINVAPDIALYHIGPPLDLGPLPSFFYFTLSGTDSLTKDPYNQPIQFLQGEMIRVFSMTLPGHENNLPTNQAIQTWADDYLQKKDPIGDFLNSFEKALTFAVDQKFVNPDKMAVGGLSRGGFVALHAAARDKRLKFVVGFAPVTNLRKLKEFAHVEIPFLDLKPLTQKLISQNIRLYISNQDARVDTKSCFDFAMSIVEQANAQNIRSPKVEMIIYPPIGHQGHGTPPEIFKSGADWIASCLK